MPSSHKPTSDNNEIQRHYLIIDYMKITFKKGLLAAIAALTVCSARADERNVVTATDETAELHRHDEENKD